MNLNTFRTLLTTVSGLLVGVMAFLPQALGCTVDAISNAVDCAHSWLPPGWVGTIAFVLMALNLILKATSGGSLGAGLVKPTAVVDTSGKVGTVTPAAVNK